PHQQESDPRLRRLMLCLSRKRRRDCPKRQPAEKRAPMDHSITWSARRSNDWGIVRPRALAVLRLTDQVADCTRYPACILIRFSCAAARNALRLLGHPGIQVLDERRESRFPHI